MTDSVLRNPQALVVPVKTAETILLSLTEPILVLDTSLRAIMGNPAYCKIMQITLGSLRGMAVEHLIVDAHNPAQFRTVLEGVVEQGVALDDHEIECIVPPRTRKVLSICARRIALDQALPPVIVLEIRDMTKEKAAEHKIQEMNRVLQRHGVELEQINRNLDAYTHSVSHDLRTPLRLTNRIAHLLLEDPASKLSPSAFEKVQMILDSTKEMAQLIEDLLTFSHMSHARIKKRRVDMKRLAREVLSELCEDEQQGQVKIVLDELPPCDADRALLKQVWLNLLGNALKFTRQRTQAEIRIGCTQRADETVYFIQDNGLGFDMRHADSMFLVFHRLHRTQSIKGSGVGLALAKHIIERHGGRIWAEGETNRGATFYFTLGE